VRAGVLSAFAAPNFVSRLSSEQRPLRDGRARHSARHRPRHADEPGAAEDHRPKYGCFYGLDYTDDDYVAIAKAQLAFLKQQQAKYEMSGNVLCANVHACTADEAKGLATPTSSPSCASKANRSVAEHESVAPSILRLVLLRGGRSCLAHHRQHPLPPT